MKVFKYCGSDVVDKVAGGSLRFGSLWHFRKLEEETGDQQIGDRMEGVAETHLDHLQTTGRPTPEQDRALRAVGVIDEGENNSVSNITYVSHCEHLLILCLSVSGDLAIESSGYDACVEIESVEALIQCICETGLVNGETPVFNLFERVEYGPVTYLSRNADAMTQARLEASPFAKRPEYAPQQEFRIVLQPWNEWMPDIQYIQISPPDGLLKVIKKSDGIVDPARTAPVVNPFDMLSRMAALITDMKDEQARIQAELSAWHQTTFETVEARQTAFLVMSKKNTDEFRDRFYRPAKDLYWEARASGHRGDWESTLDDTSGICGWMFAGQLSRLAYDVFKRQVAAEIHGFEDPPRPHRPRRPRAA